MTHSAMLDALVGDAVVAEWFTDAADVAAMLTFEAALAAAQDDCGVLPPEAATAIATACARFEPDWPALLAGMASDGVPVPALIAALREVVDHPHRAWLHFHATSQDVVDTSLTLRLASVVAELARRLGDVLATLATLKEGQGSVAQMGRTRMQRALPVSAADKLDGWTRPLRRHAGRLTELSSRLLVVQFGGPVGTRDGLDGRGDAVSAALARHLGLADAPAWHSARDAIVEFGNWLAMLCGSLGKIGLDITLLAQNEVGAVRLTGGGRSSAMAHKSNPVGAEALVALARYAGALAAGLGSALLAENERSGAAWTLEWLLLPPLSVAAGASLRHAVTVLGGLTFVPEASA